jgi:hypothetical protein
MATREIAEWEKVDAANNFPADEGGWIEGMKRSDVNDAARADMGAMRRWYDAPEWLDLTVGTEPSRTGDYTFTLVGDFTGYFTDGRRIKMTGGSTDPWFATIVSSTFSTDPFTTVTVDSTSDGAAIPESPDPTAVFLNIIADLEVGQNIIVPVPPPLTGIGIQAAIKLVEDAGGGTIMLQPGATYVVDETIYAAYGSHATRGGTYPGNFRIIGQGATLFAEAGMDAEVLIVGDELGAATSANIIFDNVLFDGNKDNNANHNGGMIKVTPAVSFVRFLNCGFTSVQDHALYLSKVDGIWVDACVFNNISRNGIEMEDATSVNASIYIRGSQFFNFGVDVNGSGIHVAGQATISDCSFTGMDEASLQQTGIHLAQKQTASPTDESGHDCTIVNCFFAGTGLNARGIWVEGRDNAITNCIFEMDAAGTEGIYIDQTLVAETSENTIITGNVFKGLDRAVQLLQDAEHNTTTGNRFFDCTFPYTDSGFSNMFSVNHIGDVTDGITVTATAVDAFLGMNTIHSASGTGLVIETGATRTQSYLDHIRDSGTVDLTDNGSDTTKILVKHFFHGIINPLAGVHDPVTVTPDDDEFAIPDALYVFDKYADGLTNWWCDLKWNKVKIKITNQQGALLQDCILYLRWGTQRSTTPENDTLIATITGLNCGNTGSGDISHDVAFVESPFIVPFIPDVGSNDELYISATRDGTNDAHIDIEIIGEDTLGEGTWIDTYPREEKQ